MEKIGILFLIPQFSQGGSEQQLYEVVRLLDKEKFRVFVGSIISGGAKWEEFNSINGIEIVAFDRKHRFDISIVKKIIYFLKENPIYIVHAYIAPATVFGILAGLIARTPVLIIGERGKPSFSTIGTRIYFTLDRLIAHYADVIIANSEAGKNWRIRSGISPDRIMVIPNGFNSERLKLKRKLTKSEFGMQDGDPLLGIVARLDPIKDHTTLFEAVRFVREESPHIKCMLVGDGPLRERLEQIVRGKGVSENILFLGHQPNVMDFIKLFDIALLSSKYEGCSNFIVEAMACGKPVVATDVGGNRELVVDGVTGLLVNKENAQALAAAVLRLLKDEQLRMTLGKESRERIENEFMIEDIVKKTERVYWQLLARNRRRTSLLCE